MHPSHAGKASRQKDGAVALICLVAPDDYDGDHVSPEPGNIEVILSKVGTPQPCFYMTEEMLLQIGGTHWLTDTLAGQDRKSELKKVQLIVDATVPIRPGDFFAMPPPLTKGLFLKSSGVGRDGWVPRAKLLREAPATAGGAADE